MIPAPPSVLVLTWRLHRLTDLASRLDAHGEAVLSRAAEAARLPRRGWVSRQARHVQTVNDAIISTLIAMGVPPGLLNV
jgi:hypothetical protein